MRAFVHVDRVSNKHRVYSNAAIIDLLIQVILLPYGFRNRKTHKLLLYLHFCFHIPLIVLLKQFPFVTGMLRAVSRAIAIRSLWLTRLAEVADQFLTLFQLLLFQTQNAAYALQGKRQAEGSRPNHSAMPAIWRKVCTCWHSQIP